MTPQEWIDFFKCERTTKEINKTIEREARAFLYTIPPGMTASTNELVEALFPRSVGDKSRRGDDVRLMLYKVIGRLAVHELSHCCVKGEVSKRYMGKDARPWVWFCPECCPMCGQAMPIDPA